MKKSIIVFLAMSVFFSMMLGCGIQSTSGDRLLEKEAETFHEIPEAVVCLADGEAFSEEEFLQGIFRNENAYAAWGLLEHWEYYYRPVYVPVEFALDKILFAGGYLVYIYTNEADELYEFVWNVTLSEEAVRGYGKEIEVPDSDDMYVVAGCGMDFYEAKYNEEYRASRKDSIYGDGWSMTFITQESVFNIGMPFSIDMNEEEFGRIMQVERVYIKGK
ncbi:MAG: hypothetical protein FWE59_01280 [Oscillospiraceae bacterium]|nr:hypothetical protein [Oscillospiraceae bacterium]